MPKLYSGQKCFSSVVQTLFSSWPDLPLCWSPESLLQAGTVVPLGLRVGKPDASPAHSQGFLRHVETVSW